MRVVQLYKDYYPPTVGGIEQTVERMSRELVRAGAQVTVLTSHPGSRQTVEESVNGVRLIRCGEWAVALSTPLCPSMPGRLASLEADVIHLHYPSPPGEVSCLAARPGGAVVLTWHCDIVRQRAVLPVYGRFIHALLRRADAVMPTYEKQPRASSFLRHYLDKCRLVPLGIDLEAFDPRPELTVAAEELRLRHGTPLILFVGRLVGYKGVDVLLHALRDVPAKLIVVGNGPDQVRLEALCARLRLTERVTFTGRVEPSRVARYVAAADVGVLPSIASQETFGLSMVEMMSHGLPVVCTEIGTGTSFVNQHEVTGLVVPPGDPQALATALNRLIADPQLRSAMGARARERAHAHFSVSAMMRGVVAVYEEALASRGGARRTG